MSECFKRAWGVCFVSKEFATGEWTNLEWKILGEEYIMPKNKVGKRTLPARIPVLLDPIPELRSALKEAMKTEHPVCGAMAFSVGSNNIQWLLGGEPSRDPKKIAKHIDRYISGQFSRIRISDLHRQPASRVLKRAAAATVSELPALGLDLGRNSSVASV